MLLTAFAATVVIVSWIADPAPGTGPAAAPAHDTQLAEHPLTGLGGGITVREVTQDVPFSLVALTGDLAGTSTRVRARHTDGSWGPWYQTDFETGGADAVGPPGPRSTDPVFVGTTTSVQIAVTRAMDAQVTSVPAEPRPGLGYKPATKEQPFGQNISHWNSGELQSDRLLKQWAIVVRTFAAGRSAQTDVAMPPWVQ